MKREDKVIKAVEIATGISSDEWFRKSNRMSHCVKCRYICYYIMTRKLNMTTTKTGSYMGKDHSTIIHGIKSVENMWLDMPKMYDKENEILNKALMEYQSMTSEENVYVDHKGNKWIKENA